jgi:hypothetical protein
VTGIRAKTASVLLIASILTLASSSSFALSRHEICDAMRHACDKADETISCCCGDRSESNPSQTATVRTDGASKSTVALLAGIPPATLAPAVMFPQLDVPPLTRPPGLPILFGDLRI